LIKWYTVNIVCYLPLWIGKYEASELQVGENDSVPVTIKHSLRSLAEKMSGFIFFQSTFGS
jgi:hypothetical protein